MNESGTAHPRAQEPPAKRHPIQVVARRTGLTPDLLRAWERRYGVVEPGRTDGGRRLYSDADVEYLHLLREATRRGRRIGDVSALTPEELERLVREDRRAARRRAREDQDAEASHSLASPYLEECLAAVRALDAPRLEATLARAVVALRPLTLVEEVAGPLMREIGGLWAEGRLTPGHERLASGALRATLSEMTAAMQPGGPSVPRIVVATPQGQAHELGALLAAVAAAETGWQVTYLGADLPTTDIASAARETGARAIALSVVYPSDDRRLVVAFRELKRALSPGVTIFVGGAAASGYRKVLDEIAAHTVSDTRSFQSALQGLLLYGGRNGRGPEERSS